MPQPHSPLIIGHRGIAGHYPENTEVSIRAAATAGLEWVEIDIQPTQDNRLVVTHDFTLERCSNGAGRVDAHTLAALKALDFGSWKHDSFAEQTVLSFEELLELVCELSLKVNIEIKLDKSQQQAATLEWVSKSVLESLQHSPLPLEHVIISSFCHSILRTLKQQSPHVRLGVISDRLTAQTWQAIEDVSAYSCHLKHCWVNETQISRLKKHGLKVMCFTVNQPHKFKYLQHVDGVFTDYPERFSGHHMLA